MNMKIFGIVIGLATIAAVVWLWPGGEVAAPVVTETPTETNPVTNTPSTPDSQKTETGGEGHNVYTNKYYNFEFSYPKKVDGLELEIVTHDSQVNTEGTQPVLSFCNNIDCSIGSLMIINDYNSDLESYSATIITNTKTYYTLLDEKVDETTLGETKAIEVYTEIDMENVVSEIGLLKSKSSYLLFIRNDVLYVLSVHSADQSLYNSIKQTLTFTQ